MGSFQTALSALKASSTAIDSVGNNLANINTTGFKRSDVSFSDLVNSAAGTPSQVSGGGVSVPAAFRQFTQGSVSGTGNSLDAAIQGNGFFVIKPGTESSTAPGALEYTRNGRFQVSGTGLLLNGNGARVQGWNADPLTGIVDSTGPVTDIAIPVGSVVAPVPTTEVDISANFDAAAPEGTSLSIPLQVIDPLGGGHQLTLKVTKSATANTWDLTLTTTDPSVQDGDDLTSKLSATTLSFVNGVLDPATDLEITISGVEFTAESGIPTLPDITWNVWKTPPSGSPAAGGVSGLTQFSQSSAISFLRQNGSPAGTLAGVRIGDNGRIVASYTNGLEAQIAQLALAVIQNPTSLLDAGGNSYRATHETMALPPSEPGVGGAGTIVGQAQEASNVDIAQEFTNLITYQRSYQASSRIITTIDQLTLETLNLKQ